MAEGVGGAEYELVGYENAPGPSQPITAMNRRTTSHAAGETGRVLGYDVEVRAPSITKAWTRLYLHLETRDCILKGVETPSE